MKRLQIIDLLRSLSIFVVMGRHFTEMIPALAGNYLSIQISDFFSNGGLGVSIFFTISGFLITEIITMKKQDRFEIDVKGFYVKRIGRIYPLVYLMLVVGLFFFYLYDFSTPAQNAVFKNDNYRYDFWFWASIPLFFFNLIVAQQHGNFGTYWRVLWSLAIEEQFYLIYPWILKALKRKGRVMIFLGVVIALGLVYRAAYIYFYPQPWINFLNSFAYFDQIAIGAALYFVSNQWKKTLIENKFRCVILCFVGIVIMLETYLNMNINKPSYLNYAYFLAPLCVSLGSAIFLLGGLHLRFFELKFWRPFSIPGQLSYSCYLFHWGILCFLYPLLLNLNPINGLLLFAATTFMAAYFSYVFFERPSNNWIRNYFGEKKSLPLSIRSQIRKKASTSN
jgi:peptidoglycan/LPS O-acetylase OafA/YrhL